MKKGLVSKILSGGLAVAMVFGLFSSPVFAANTQLHELLKKEGPVDYERVCELASSHPEWVYDEDDEGKTPLHLAAERGYLEVVKYLVKERGADVDCADRNGWRPLYLADLNDHPEVVNYLASRYPDWINKRGYGDLTPLHDAAYRGKIEVVKYLVDECKADGWSAVFGAALFGEIEVVKFFIERNPAILDCKDGQGRSLIDVARTVMRRDRDNRRVIENKAEIIKYLESEIRKRGAQVVKDLESKGAVE